MASVMGMWQLGVKLILPSIMPIMFNKFSYAAAKSVYCLLAQRAYLLTIDILVGIQQRYTESVHCLPCYTGNIHLNIVLCGYRLNVFREIKYNIESMVGWMRPFFNWQFNTYLTI